MPRSKPGRQGAGGQPPAHQGSKVEASLGQQLVVTGPATAPQRVEPSFKAAAPQRGDALVITHIVGARHETPHNPTPKHDNVHGGLAEGAETQEAESKT